MYNRYSAMEKFITDPEKLEIVNGSEVYISREEDYDIVVDLEGRTEDFKALKPSIVLAARSICELDNIAQRFDRARGGNGLFPYVVEVVFIDGPYIILEYWGTEENTQFDVVFERQEDGFALKSFGTVLDIPANWDRPASNGEEGEARSSKGGFLSRWFHKRKRSG